MAGLCKTGETVQSVGMFSSYKGINAVKNLWQVAAAILLIMNIHGCKKDGLGGHDSTAGKNSKQNLNPSVGQVRDSSGFFVEVLAREFELFNMHRGLSSFDEPCKLADGEKVLDCFIDAEEQTFYAQPFSLHYHIPSSMCAYVSFMPFYFVNHQSKLQTSSLVMYVDKNGALGIDNNQDGVNDSSDFGCYKEQGVPSCCVGNFLEVKYVWNPASNSYGEPTTTNITRKMNACLGGPAVRSQPLNELGIPTNEYIWVSGQGVSKEYQIETPAKHNVASAWIANFFDPAQHAATNNLPGAFREDIDVGAGVFEVGHPYYSIGCYDTDLEKVAQINVQLREWNTKSAFEARNTNPAAYDDTGFESDPFSQEQKNDFKDWFDLISDVHPDFVYKD